jgi:osmoprotectant transport system ATP-binding protein
MIRLLQVTKSYPGQGGPAVNQLSFEVPEGETCVLIGPSGCGKTTTLKMINRLIEPSSGEIYLGGDNILHRNAVELRRAIGYVIQQVGLFPHMTIRDNVAVVPRLLGWPRARINGRVDELLDMVGMDPAEFRNRFPRELSGGQQQRVGVARALAADPPVMLLDEPFGALDPITRDRLQNEFLRLQKRIKKTLVFVTHDIDEALKMGTLICILRVGGMLAQFDTPANLLAAPADDFVADFVGADRGLKRLNLVRVGEAMQTQLDVAHPADSTADVVARMRGENLDSLLIVDPAGRLLGYVSLEVAQARPGKTAGDILHPVAAVTQEEATMKDAFSQMLSAGVGYMPVVGEGDRLAGIVTAAVAQRLIEIRPTRSRAEGVRDG